MITFIVDFRGSNAIRYGQDQVKKRIQYQSNLPNLTEVQCDISDLPFVRNKDYHY